MFIHTHTHTHIQGSFLNCLISKFWQILSSQIAKLVEFTLEKKKIPIFYNPKKKIVYI
jgi:hypothetical protein